MMMRYFRKLAKPLTFMSLLGFVGQVLVIYCVGMSGAAAAIVADNAVATTHHHSAMHHNTGQNTGAMPTHDVPCCCKHNGVPCDTRSSHHPAILERSQQQLKTDFQHDDFDAILNDPVVVLNYAVKPDIPPKPGFSRTRISPAPTYLVNCTFLE